MSKPMLRKGPRVTICVDFNLQWLWPKITWKDGLGYIHLGWFSALVGMGKARDTFYDVFDTGLSAREKGHELVEETLP